MVLMWLLAGAVMAMAAGGWWYFSQLRQRPKPEPFVYFRCCKCKGKLRFQVSKAGRPGMCPRCRERWTIPSADSGVLKKTPVAA